MKVTFMISVVSLILAIWPAAAAWPRIALASTQKPNHGRPGILWRNWVGLLGYQNTPIIVGDSVYIASSGRVWNRPDDAFQPEDSLNTFGNPDQGRSDGIYALDWETGKIRWFVGLEAEPNGIFISGNYLAYAAQGETGRFRSPGQLGVIDTRTGKLAWKFEQGDETENFTHVLIADESLIAVNLAGEVLSFELRTGKLLWKKTFSGSFRAAPIRDGQLVYLASTRGQVVCLRWDGTLVWQAEIEHAFPDWSRRREGFPVEFYASPVLTENRLILSFARNAFYPHPALVALDKSTGRIDWWARDDLSLMPRHANIRSRPALWQNKLVVAESVSNRVLVVDAGSGRLESVLAIGQPTLPHWPSAAVFGDQLILPRHDGYLYGWDLSNGTERWKIYLGQRNLAGKFMGPTVLKPETPGWMPDVGDAIYVSPAMGPDGSVVIGSDGYLYRIGME